MVKITAVNTNSAEDDKRGKSKDTVNNTSGSNNIACDGLGTVDARKDDNSSSPEDDISVSSKDNEIKLLLMLIQPVMHLVQIMTKLGRVKSL